MTDASERGLAVEAENRHRQMSAGANSLAITQIEQHVTNQATAWEGARGGVKDLEQPTVELLLRVKAAAQSASAAPARGQWTQHSIRSACIFKIRHLQFERTL